MFIFVTKWKPEAALLVLDVGLALQFELVSYMIAYRISNLGIIFCLVSIATVIGMIFFFVSLPVGVNGLIVNLQQCYECGVELGSFT